MGIPGRGPETLPFLLRGSAPLIRQDLSVQKIPHRLREHLPFIAPIESARGNFSGWRVFVPQPLPGFAEGVDRRNIPGR